MSLYGILESPMNELIADKQKQLSELCRRFHVRRLALFGSSLNSDFDPGRSDLDFLVEFQTLAEGEHAHSYFGLSEALQTLFGRPVDLIERDAIRNPYIKQEIERTQQTVYGA